MVTRTATSLDDAIKDAYVEIGIGADKLVANTENRRLFVSRVRRLMKNSTVSEDEICDRLISLRKLGQDNGGLPRLERVYNGRGRHEINKPR